LTEITVSTVATALARDRERRMEEARISGVRQRHATLTPREVEVFALVTAGKMNKQMAGELKLSEITIKIHRGSVAPRARVRQPRPVDRPSGIYRERDSQGIENSHIFAWTRPPRVMEALR
jgi:DNA-binding CsgD family transcriptional regulator